jgi:hypothetical protein
MTPTDVRQALTEVREATDVPVVDRIAFQRRVRSERHRRTLGRAAAATGAAAAVVSVVALAGGVGLGDDRRVDPEPVGRPATGSVSETVFFVLDGRLTALDPAGVVHDLGVRSEGVVGWTSERVYALDDDSHVVVRTVSYDDEGSRRATFGSDESPVGGPVRTVALSGDGRYLGWTDIDDVAHRYDLKAGREDLTISGNAGAAVAGVGADGLLLYTADGLVVRDDDSVVQVPVDAGWTGTGAQLAFGHVLVPDRDGASTLFDLRDGAARLVDTLDGFGTLGPYAERVALLGQTAADQQHVGIWDGGTVTEVTGLDAMPDQVRWADEATLLVAGYGADGSGLWACDIDLACARLPVAGQVNLGE